MTKNMQKNIKNIQKCLKSIKYMILGTLRAFVQWHVAMIARHSLQLIMILNLDVDFMTLTKNHTTHLHQKKNLVFVLVKSERGYESTSQKISVNGVVEEILHAKNTCTTTVLISYYSFKFGDNFF